MADDAFLDTDLIDPAAGRPVLRLWPDGPPGGASGAGPEVAEHGPAVGRFSTLLLRNVTDPTLTVFAPEPRRANGAGVIICPGGGFRLLFWEHEGVDVARWFAARGYTAFLLKYRLMATPPDRAPEAPAAEATPAPIPFGQMCRRLDELVPDAAVKAARAVAAEDGRRALAVIREQAAAWGLRPDRIGMVGFSAAGFLTADVAVDPGGAPLAFAAVVYGGDSGGRSVPADAPPLFAVNALDDRLTLGCVQGLFADWAAADRPAELHVYARGGHGFGMHKIDAPVARWTDRLEEWMKDRRLLEKP